MGSKRLTKSSLAQMRNPDLVINLKKEKTDNKNSDAQVVINDCTLVMYRPHLNYLTKWRGLSYPNPCFSNCRGDFITHFKADGCHPKTRPCRKFKLVAVFINNLGNVEFIFFPLDKFSSFLYLNPAYDSVTLCA